MRKLFVVEMNAFQNLLLALDFHFGINGSQMLFDSRDADEDARGEDAKIACTRPCSLDGISRSLRP